MKYIILLAFLVPALIGASERPKIQQDLINMGALINKIKTYQNIDSLQDPEEAENVLNDIKDTASLFNEETYANALQSINVAQQQFIGNLDLQNYGNLNDWIDNQISYIEIVLEQTEQDRLKQKEEEEQKQQKLKAKAEEEKKREEEKAKEVRKISNLTLVNRLYSTMNTETVKQLQDFQALSELASQLKKFDQYIADYASSLEKEIGSNFQDLKTWSDEMKKTISDRKKELGGEKIFKRPPKNSIPPKEWQRFPEQTQVRTTQGKILTFPVEPSGVYASYFDENKNLLNVSEVITPNKIFDLSRLPDQIEYAKWLKSLNVIVPGGVVLSTQELAEKLIDLEIQLMALHKSI